MNSEEFKNFKQNCIYVRGLSDNEAYIEFLKYNKNSLINKLSTTDYEAIKYAEGWFTEEEYQPIKEERENIRIQIRSLEEDIKELEERVNN